MSERFNPYYTPSKLGLEMISFDEPDLCYEYNTAIFVKTPTGEVYMATDSGCSCPTPFEDYESENMQSCIQRMDRMANQEDAIGHLKTWGRDYRGRSWVDEGDYMAIRNFFNS